MSRKIPFAVQMRPVRYATIYLCGTFALFLFGSLRSEVSGLSILTIFVALSFAALYFGYWLGIRTRKERHYPSVSRRSAPRKVRLVCWVGAAYFAVFGLNMLLSFGYTAPMEVLDAIMNPGASYRAKFEIFAEQQRYGDVNRITQLMVIFSVIYAMFIPVMVCYWRLIPRFLRWASLASVMVYVVAFLAIGTMKGVGDTFLLALAGASVLLGSGTLVLSREHKLRIAGVIGVLVVAMAGYMVGNQSSRAGEFDKTGSMIVGDVTDTALADLIGDSWAYGVYATLAYPSHGYAGLALDLQQEFVFAKGAGLSPAFESYRLQYLGGQDNSWLTYPARTEIATGWPADRVWSTAFPWFASDLTFPGVIFLMGLVGFLFARVWLSCIINGDLLSLTVLGQLYIVIAFLPANNQLLMQRQGLWICASLLAWAAMRFLARVRF